MRSKSKRTYRTVSCHRTKALAKKKQKSLHEKGKTARLKKKEGGGYCVTSAGKKKTAKRKATRRRKRS